MKRIIIDFVWLSLLCAAIFLALAYFFPDLGRPAGAVTTVVASMTAGQLHGQRTKTEVTSSFAWRVAGAMTLASILIAIASVLALEFSGFPVVPDGPGALSGSAVLMILVVGCLLVLLIARFSFRWGVKQGVRTAR